MVVRIAELEIAVLDPQPEYGRLNDRVIVTNPNLLIPEGSQGVIVRVMAEGNEYKVRITDSHRSDWQWPITLRRTDLVIVERPRTESHTAVERRSA